MEYIELLNANFLGKVCTILTSATSLPVQDAIGHSRYFTGKVKRIDQFGVWVENLLDGTVSFFSFPIVGMVEEKSVSKEDPRYEKLKADVEKQREKKSPPAAKKLPSSFIDVEELMASVGVKKR